MDFHFTEEQNILRKTARDFLESECPSSFVLEMEADEKGYTEKMWQRMADLGWIALIIPEEYGGVGGGLLDLVVMMEEMGRACLPSPYFSSIVLGAITIIEAGNGEQKESFLPKIATGDLKLTMAHLEPCTTKYEPWLVEAEALPKEENYVINGTKLFVPDAHVADYIICVAKTRDQKDSKNSLTLFLVESSASGLEIVPLKNIAGSKEFEVSFNNVMVSKKDILGSVNEGASYLDKVLQIATVCKCSEMVGAAQKVLEMASSYAKEREQFGKPIGSFQAVQHHCANMLIAIEGSRYITYKTAWMLDKGIPCRKEVSVTKAWVSESYKEVVRLGHQVQGATAYMVEHDMPLYSRRAKVAEMVFGDANYHRQVVADELGL